jgi:intracellular multiplication protein IcmO
MVAYNTKGSSANYRPEETRRDVRRFSTKFHAELMSEDGATYLLMIVVILCGVGFFLPFGNEITFLITLGLSSVYMHPKERLYNFPWRVPIHAKLLDGSRNLELANDIAKGNARKENPKLMYGEGVTYF